MADMQITDPKALSLQKKLKIVGAGAIAVAGSGIVIVGGLGIIAACGVGLVAVAAVNIVPVVARYIALKKQQALTALAETFSEETIRADEEAEAGRVQELETEYKVTKSELQGAQEVLRDEIEGSDEQTAANLTAQIATVQDVIDRAGAKLEERMEDLKQLRKANRVYIAFERSARAMLRAEGAERTAAERQRVEEARNAIKTRMRAAGAGQEIKSMRDRVGDSMKLSTSKAAALGMNTSPSLQQSIIPKETSNVPRTR